jgi:hypothetical protein
MAHKFSLPASVVGPADLVRLKRDLEALNNLQDQADLRARAGGPKAEVFEAGKVLSELAASNEFDLHKTTDRRQLLTELETTIKSAPTVTMSFAVDPSAAFMAKIVDWLRTSIDPMVLVRVGLQPSIAAGCTLRTGSRIYDFSLRNKFTEQRPMLIKRLSDASQKVAS